MNIIQNEQIMFSTNTILKKIKSMLGRLTGHVVETGDTGALELGSHGT